MTAADNVSDEQRSAALVAARALEAHIGKIFSDVRASRTRVAPLEI
jgi:hypothetical protein